MKKQDPVHSQQVAAMQQLAPIDFKRRVAVQSHKQAEFVASEVLAALVRQSFGNGTGLADATAAELNRRIVKLVSIRIRRHATWRKLLERNSELIEDTVMYVWDKLLSDPAGSSNAEVRFEVFLGDRVIDHMRHQMTAKNSMRSVDEDEDDDDEDPRQHATDLVEDPNGELPEEAVMRRRKSEELTTLLISLPKAERNAFYYRIECEYEWARVAELLKCSIPTARAHLQRGWEKLQGANE